LLFRALRPQKKTPAVPEEILGVRVRQSLRARRMALRVDSKTGEVLLTWPRRGSLAQAEKFIAENRRWIERQRQNAAPVQEFHDGMRLFLCGTEYTVTHTPGRGLTRIEGDRLIVTGRAEHLPRRLRDFIKLHAARVLQENLDEKTAKLGIKGASLRILDPKTRWGSCGPDRKIMLSWRLVLAPPFVMDYVVAHEAAHCVHLNHGRKFWALCASLTQDASGARKWLSAHGQSLMRYRA
jgi:predicted metal-dependent hydrolase